LYNGLIPNLLDARRFPRFNSRDAVWWFSYALLRHAQSDPKILDSKVKMRFPGNGYVDYKVWLELGSGTSMTMRKILTEILRCHAQGIHFIEHNAGPSLDPHMTEQGFVMDIRVDWSTGLIHGGNAANCGTWMDKMGSVPGINAGVPSTPRDGAAIEINALCCLCLRLFLELCGDVQLTEAQSVSTWYELLKANFDSSFYSEQLGYYKDTVGSSSTSPSTPDADLSLRPNFLVATCLLHDILDVRHVRRSLERADRELLGPQGIGMRTLSPSSKAYNPDYDLNDGTGGANYHNGPEWPWLTAYYIRSSMEASHNVDAIPELLARIQVHLMQSPMGGVAELTNADGNYCPHACPSQAWSMACLREAVHYFNDYNNYYY
jgi:glycogen debranching enzyme